MYMDGWGGGGLALCGHDGHLVVWLALGEQKKKLRRNCCLVPDFNQIRREGGSFSSHFRLPTSNITLQHCTLQCECC